ncbi:uncharacterized protein LOC119836536 [Zerene cesonia]|uniref:uncharacterized protein LOC119836536 n=1 Tax=Zerene cesonia TaxID=33412 RepID=UPI0018E5086E|nr:uncharacterized protein LOC119836536 [Zerene cesonia]
MSYNTNWDVEKYREEHESEDHWQLRRAFIERWKENYPEERLICLAQVFANIEFMGCRYPIETMQEVARLSKEVAINYRKQKKTKLQRTFVSASDAAEDRAKGIKREGGVVKDSPPAKSTKIEFVPQGQSVITTDQQDSDDNDDEKCVEQDVKDDDVKASESDKKERFNSYREELGKIDCLDMGSFRENMFITPFGRFVLLVRPWAAKQTNIQASAQACHLILRTTYKPPVYSLALNGELLAEASGDSKAEARCIAETLAWNRLKECSVSLMVKEQFRAQGDREISMSDVSGKKEEFGTPVENSVATKMMKLMGWKGGGLGADAQGIEEPIKPNLQMVNRAGLGSTVSDIRALRRAGFELMKRYLSSDTLDVELVFSSEFGKEERAVLHQCAKRVGLGSRSYGDKDRFLVVRKKLDPFSLVRAVVEKGGDTPKYQVFIPTTLANGR